MATRKAFVRTEYNYDPDAVSSETGLKCLDNSLTQQSQMQEADINVIVERFGVTGHIPILNREALDPDAFHDVLTFQDAQNAVRAAEEAFMQIPPHIRAKFMNNPGVFVEFASDPKNLDALREMGLAKAAEVVQDASVTTKENVNGRRNDPASDDDSSQDRTAGEGASGKPRAARSDRPSGRDE